MTSFCPPPSALLFMALAISFCASHATGVMEPIAFAAQYPAASKVEMLIETSRLSSKKPSELFAGERSPKPSLTEVTVSIPPDSTRKAGEVEWPKRLPANPKTDFAVTAVEPLTSVHDEVSWMKQHNHSGHVLVFVHGFNNTYGDAVFRYAQIVHDSGAEVTPIMFTWPSRARLFDYVYDKESANYSRAALEDTLRNLADDPDVKDITVLAHSMGTWLAMESLRQMAIRDHRIDPKIKNVVLASPDIDVDVFARQFVELGEHRPRFTIFVSQDDRALAASRFLSGDVDRVGSIDPTKEPYRTAFENAGITAIDLTKIKTEDGMRHGKFAERPLIVQLIGKRLVRGQTLTGTDLNPVQGLTAVVAGSVISAETKAEESIIAPGQTLHREKDPAPDKELNDILDSGADPALAN
jgi:esterase/lipase superfamily enzyme